MSEQAGYDYSSDWVEETGAGTGDARTNDPRNAGFTDEDDRVFRSHFQRVNQLADRGYEQARPAYELGLRAATDARYADRDFEEVESDLEHGWLNVRTAFGDWASVREMARAGFEQARAGIQQGRLPNMPPAGDLQSRPTYADPVADNTDPTAPDSPEQTFERPDDETTR